MIVLILLANLNHEGYSNANETNLEDLEAGNIEYTDEVLSLLLGVECLVDTSDQPKEHLSVQSLGKSSHCVDNL